MTEKPLSPRWKRWLIAAAVAIPTLLLAIVWLRSALLSQAERAMVRRDWQRAALALRWCRPIAGWTNNAQYHYLTGRLLTAQGEEDSAIQQFSRISPNTTQFRDACPLWVRLLLKQDRLSEAESVLQQCIARWNTLTARLELARLYFLSDRKDAARQLLWSMLPSHPEPIRVLFLIWAIDYDPVHALERLATLEEALRQSPSDQELRLSLARSYLELNRVSDARALLEPGQVPRPPEARRLQLLVQCHLLEGDLAQAAANLKALDEMPDADLGATERLWARLEMARDDLQRAATHWLNVAAASPHDPEPHYHLGRIWRQLNQSDRADQAIERFHGMRATIDRMRVAITRVRDSTTSAVVRDPALFARVGEHYEQLNLPREALAWHEQALAVNPGYEPSIAASARLRPAAGRAAATARATVRPHRLDPPDPPPAAIRDPLQPSVRSGPANVTFANTAPARGINFAFEPRRQGEFFMGETTGGGGGWLDYDADGRFDLYLVQGCRLPYRPGGEDRNVLFRSRPDGLFESVPQAAAADDHYGQGLAVADFDNDGFSDLYVSNYGPDVLYQNNGDGTFADVSLSAGTDCELYGTSSAFADLDRDGDMDLYVANYVVWDAERPPVCRGGAADQRGYCGAEFFAGEPDRLYRNDGDGRFSDVTAHAGVEPFLGRGLGVAITDFDNDQLPDIYVANDRDPCYLFRNRGDLHFEECGLVSGCAVNENGLPTAAMGIACGDYDDDGNMDIFITNFRLETNTLFRNSGSRGFADTTRAAQLAAPSLPMVAWGTQFVDVDNDGRLDLFVANGNTHDHRDPAIMYEMEPQLFWNAGTGAFADVSVDAGEYFRFRWRARAAAVADFDNNGTADLAVIHQEQPVALLENSGAPDHSAIGLVLIGRESNRSGMGVRVTATVGGRTIVRETVSGGSYLAAHDSRLLVGLGEHARADRLTIRWPSGLEASVPGVAAGRYVRIVEGQENAVEMFPFQRESIKTDPR